MTTNTHTPGTWVALPASPVGWVDIVVPDNGGWSLPIASTRHKDYEANARLIAAAPDMLAALQLIARGYGVTFQDAALRGLVADAIAKATGEPHA